MTLRTEWAIATNLQLAKREEHLASFDVVRLNQDILSGASKSSRAVLLKIEEEASLVNLYLNSLKPPIQPNDTKEVEEEQSTSKKPKKRMLSLIKETLIDNAIKKNQKLVNWVQMHRVLDKSKKIEDEEKQITKFSFSHNLR